MTKPIPKPMPVVVTTICSLCDEGWELHGDNPTTADCIRLLKAKIASLPVTAPVYIYRDNWPWGRPLAQPYYPSNPMWTHTAQGTSATSSGLAATLSGSNTTSNVIEFRTPRDDDDGDSLVPVQI